MVVLPFFLKIVDNVTQITLQQKLFWLAANLDFDTFIEEQAIS